MPLTSLSSKARFILLAFLCACQLAEEECALQMAFSRSHLLFLIDRAVQCCLKTLPRGLYLVSGRGPGQRLQLSHEPS